MFQGLIGQPLYFFFFIPPPSLALSLKWQKILVRKTESAGKNMTYKVSPAVWGSRRQGGDAVPPCMGAEDFSAGGRADVTQGSPALVCRMYLSRSQNLERSHPIEACWDQSLPREPRGSRQPSSSMFPCGRVVTSREESCASS